MAICQHEPAFSLDEDQVLICEHCERIIAHQCDMCGGIGYGQENELECDWINFGDDLISCPRCCGARWLYTHEYSVQLGEDADPEVSDGV